jgi:hypothetical protein
LLGFGFKDYIFEEMATQAGSAKIFAAKAEELHLNAPDPMSPSGLVDRTNF